MAKRIVKALVYLLLATLALLVLSGRAYSRFRFQENLSIAETYNTNIYSATTNPKADFITYVTPKITLNDTNARRFFNIDLSYTRTQYAKTIDLNRDNFTAGFSTRYTLSRKATLDLFDTVSYTPRTTTTTNKFSPVTPTGFVPQLVVKKVESQLVTNNFGTSLRYKLSRTSTLTLSARDNIQQYSSKDFTSTNDQSYTALLTKRIAVSRRDALSLAASATHSTLGSGSDTADTVNLSAIWNRKVSKRLHGDAKVRFSDNRSSGMQEIGVTDSLTYSADASMTYEFNRYTTIRASGGYTMSAFTGNSSSNGGGGNKGGPNYELSLVRRFVHSTLSASLSGRTGAGFQSSYDSTSAALGYSYRITPKLTWSANMSYLTEKSSSGKAIDSTATTYSTHLNYRVGNNAYLNMSYSNTNQKSTGTFNSGTMKQNMVTFSLDLVDINHWRP